MGYTLGEGTENLLCLGTIDRAEFSLCTGDAITLRRTPRGTLVELMGMRDFDIGFDAFCESNIMGVIGAR
jgi:hypothetical protein